MIHYGYLWIKIEYLWISMDIYLSIYIYYSNKYYALNTALLWWSPALVLGLHDELSTIRLLCPDVRPPPST